MCGIYGWQWRRDRKPTAGQRLIIAAVLGQANDSRGGDSFGWYATELGVFHKGMGEISPDARFAAHHDSIICHTRKATVGAKTIENAHPFSIGSVVGAHNGSVYNHDDLSKERHKYEVDSQHIFHGLEAKTDLAGVRGHGAIEWVDKRVARNTINLVRASVSADLAAIVTDQGVVWTSAGSALRSAMALSGLGNPQHVFEITSLKIHQVRDGRMYKLDKELKFDEWKPQQYQPVAIGQTYGSQQSWREFIGDPDPTPPAFHVTKSVRKTIGKAAVKLAAGAVAYLCGSCYRETDLQRRCPRGHAGGVVEMRERGADAK